MSRMYLLLLILALKDVSAGWTQDVPSPLPTPEAAGLRCLAHASDIDPASLQSSTGNQVLDNYISAESAELLDVFGLAPLLKYVNGPDWDNAAASDAPRAGFTTGTVYVGIPLLADEFQDPRRGRHAVVGVLAHEFGHILQYHTEGATFTDPIQTELHADFMAGYYMGKRNMLKPTDLDNFALALFLRGDPPDFFEAPDHGNGYQRLAAMLAGYQSKDQAPSDAYNTGRKVAYELTTIIDNATEFPELDNEDMDVQARAQMQITSSHRFINSPSNPRYLYRATLQNAGSEPIVVTLIVDVTVNSSQNADGEGAQPLTRRVVQRRIVPNQTENISLELRSTVQTEVVGTRLDALWLVAFERDVSRPVPAAEPASSPTPSFPPQATESPRISMGDVPDALVGPATLA